MLQVGNGCLEHGLHDLGLEAAVVELEVVPDTPAVVQLVGVTFHADAEGIALVGYESEGRLLVHAICECNGRTGHSVGEVVGRSVA